MPRGVRQRQTVPIVPKAEAKDWRRVGGDRSSLERLRALREDYDRQEAEMKRLAKLRNAAILDAIRAGHSQRVIGAAFGVAGPRIAAIVKENGLGK